MVLSSSKLFGFKFIDQQNIAKKPVNKRGAFQWKLTRDLNEETDWENEFN